MSDIEPERLALVVTDADGFAPILHDGTTYWVRKENMVEWDMRRHMDWLVENDPRSEEEQRRDFAFEIEAQQEIEWLTWTPTREAGS